LGEGVEQQKVNLIGSGKVYFYNGSLAKSRKTSLSPVVYGICPSGLVFSSDLLPAFQVTLKLFRENPS
jgi:hypothetical protein